PPHLAEPRAAFTTLYFRGELRGCVGHVYPIDSLYRTVAETARAAAFEDTRFWPITLDEAAELEVSLSILSPLRTVQAEQLEVGRHGLLVSLHSIVACCCRKCPSITGGIASPSWSRPVTRQVCRRTHGRQARK